jgi:hypothetical protein
VQFLRLVVPFDSGGGVLGLVLRSAPARQTVEGYGRSGRQAPSRKRSLRHNRGAGMRPISSTLPILPPWVNPDFAGEPWCRRLEGDFGFPWPHFRGTRVSRPSAARGLAGPKPTCRAWFPCPSSLLAYFCLYGCFSKPPDVVVSNGGACRRSVVRVGLSHPGWAQCSARAEVRGLEGRTNPAIWLLSRPNFAPLFASFVANTTCWGLLKQPYKQESAM